MTATLCLGDNISLSLVFQLLHSSVMLSELSELCYIGLGTHQSLILDTSIIVGLHQLLPMQVVALHSKGENGTICRYRHRYSDDKQQESISSHLKNYDLPNQARELYGFRHEFPLRYDPKF